MNRSVLQLTLHNPLRADLGTLEVEAVADDRVFPLVLPESIASTLALEARDVRRVRANDGRDDTVPYVGPVAVRLADRVCIVGAIVAGDVVRFGSIVTDSLGEARA